MPHPWLTKKGNRSLIKTHQFPFRLCHELLPRQYAPIMPNSRENSRPTNPDGSHAKGVTIHAAIPSPCRHRQAILACFADHKS